MSKLAVLNLENGSNTIRKLTEMKSYFKQSAEKVNVYRKHGLANADITQGLRYQEMLIKKMEECIKKAKDTLDTSFNRVSKVAKSIDPSTNNILDAAVMVEHANEYREIANEWGKVSTKFGQSDMEAKNALLIKDALPKAAPKETDNRMGVLLSFPKNS